jgi:hypothetical protein
MPHAVPDLPTHIARVPPVDPRHNTATDAALQPGGPHVAPTADLFLLSFLATVRILFRVFPTAGVPAASSLSITFKAWLILHFYMYIHNNICIDK